MINHPFDGQIGTTVPVTEVEAVGGNNGSCLSIPLFVDRQYIASICVLEDGRQWEDRGWVAGRQLEDRARVAPISSESIGYMVSDAVLVGFV